MRRLGPFLFALALAGCPPPSSPPPPSATATDAPPPPRIGPGRFADEATVGSQAFFVRLSRLVIGGDFDSWGSEEVEASLVVGGETRRAFRAPLELPDAALEAFDLADEEWLELAPLSPTEVGLMVRDEDGTDWETIAGTPHALVLEEGAFGAEGAPASLPVDLGTIRGTRSGFMVASSSFTIPEASATLHLCRAPRREAADDASRKVAREAFAEALAATAPGTARDAGALAASLGECAARARRAAPRSTHTRVRRALPKLAEQAAAAAALAEAAAAADPDRVRAALKEVGDAAGLLRLAAASTPPSAPGAPPSTEAAAPAPAAVAAAEALARTAVTEVTPAAMDALLAQVDAVERAWGGPPPESPAAPGGGLRAALQACAKAARAAKDGLPRLPDAAKALAELQAALGPEAGP